MDGWVAEHLHDAVRGHPLVVDVLRAVTALGRPQTLVLACLVAALVLAGVGRWRLGALLVAATLGAWLLNVGIKDLIGRDRPVWDVPLARSSGASFPSGHAMVSAAAYGAVALVVRRRWLTVAAGAVVLAVAATRVALGVHWLTDVIAGVGIGAAWAWICARSLVRGEDPRARDRTVPEDLARPAASDAEPEPR